MSFIGLLRPDEVVFALGLQHELQDLFRQRTLTIAELERLSAEPKRQRVRPCTK